MPADDYLKERRTKDARPVPEKSPSEEYLKVHFEQAAMLGGVDINPKEFFDQRLRDAKDRIGALLKPDLASKLRDNVAIGTLENPALNAYIQRRRGTEEHVILVNRGFLSVVNHYVKLTHAAIRPADVIYYQGLDPTKLVGETYLQANQRMLAAYRRDRIAEGPELKLRTGGAALLSVEFSLHQMHDFVVAHEIGHFVNGDLANIATLAAMDDGMMRLPPLKHMQEFLADQFAFAALLRLAALQVPDAPAVMILRNSVILFFNLLREISDLGTDSHPPLSLRLLIITDQFFGRKAGTLMRASFDDLKKWPEFEAEVERVTVRQLVAKGPGNRVFL